MIPKWKLMTFIILTPLFKPSRNHNSKNEDEDEQKEGKDFGNIKLAEIQGLKLSIISDWSSSLKKSGKNWCIKAYGG